MPLARLLGMRHPGYSRSAGLNVLAGAIAESLLPMSNPFVEYLQSGFAAHTQGRFDEAREAYLAAMALAPADVQVQYLLGSLYLQTGRHEEGEALLQRVIELQPAHPGALSNLGLCHYEAGRFAKAEDSFRKALDLVPDNADLQRKLGMSLLALKQKPGAIFHLQRALMLQPTLGPEVYPPLCGLLQDENRCFEAIRHTRNWARIKGSEQIASGHEAMAWARLGLMQHALSIADRLDADSMVLLFCKAYVADYAGDHAAAVRYYRKCLELDPDQANAHFNLSLNLFLTGQLTEAWREFEWRFAKNGVLGDHGQVLPQWDGRPLGGEGVLVHSEQGIGDVLQFMRYFPLIQQRGGKVVFGSYPDVLSLLASQDDSQILSEDEVDLSCEWQIPLLSLGGVFSPTEADIPDVVPYLQVPAAKAESWRQRLREFGAKFKVGLVWAGNPAHINDSNRSAALNDFATLAGVPGTVFFALQKGPAAAQAACPPAGMQLVSLSDEIRDFTDTAAVIENLDLVICVDTSVAHLAGALGRPVWLLLPMRCDWRWFADRDDSPWYPGMRVFRQRGWLDWPELMQRVARELICFPARRQCEPVVGNILFDDSGHLLPLAEDTAPALLDDEEARCLVMAARRDGAVLGDRWIDALPPFWQAEYCRELNPRRSIDLLESLWQQQPSRGIAYPLMSLYADAAMYERLYGVLDALQDSDSGDFLSLYWRAQQQRWQKHHESAVELYRRVLAINPRMGTAHVNLALCYKQLDRGHDALLHMQAALHVQRDHEKMLYFILQFLLDSGECLSAITLAESLVGRFGESSIKVFLATAYSMSGRFADALELIDNMSEQFQQRSDIQWTKAFCLSYRARDAEADAIYRHALAQSPDNPQLRLAYAIFLLARGHWGEGWALYEARLLAPEADGFGRKSAGLTAWQGEPLADRSLLVYAEQGLGDVLQFLRFVPPAGRIVLACQPSLVDLVGRNFPQWDVVSRDELQGMAADYAVNLMSLPAIRQLGANIHARPYLTASPLLQGFARELYAQLAAGKRVGIIWAGNPAHRNDMHRSTRLESLLPLLAGHRDIVWCSFQKDDAAMQQALLDPELLPFDAAYHAESIEHAAALLDQIDLLITIDSAMAHLAAAMGKPVWLLLSTISDWRWGLEGEATPWYPSMRIFRQAQLGDWAELIGRVDTALQQWKGGMYGPDE